ncbi:MAG: Kelch repeat-containing protein, partial [Planctomycetota bacterium]
SWNATATAERLSTVQNHAFIVSGPDFSVPGSGAAVASVDGTIYLAGGRSSVVQAVNLVSASSFIQDIPTTGAFSTDPSWTGAAAMAQARAFAGAAEHGGLVFVLGGFDASGSSLSSMERYDPTADAWTTLATSLTAPKGAFGTVKIGNKLYVMGGDTGGGTKTAVTEVFDLQTQSWDAGPFASMTVARSHFGIGLEPGSGLIYVFGGEGTGGTYLNSVESYDPVANAWTTLSNLPMGLKGPLCLEEGNRLKLFGGEILHATLGSVATNRILAYEHSSDSWRWESRTLPYAARDLFGITVTPAWTHRGTPHAAEFCLIGGGHDGTSYRDGFFRFYTR